MSEAEDALVAMRALYSKRVGLTMSNSPSIAYRRPSRSVALDLAEVRRLRIARGLSYSELGRLAGYSDVHVGLVERGLQGASPAYAKALARVLLGREDRLPHLLKGE